MRDRKPRVLSVISCLATGGAESLLYYLHKYLKSKGYDNFAICTLTGKGEFYKKAKEGELPVISLDISSSYDPRALPRLIQVVKRGNFDIVHSHLYSACFYSFLTSLLLPNIKFIHTTHGVGIEEREPRKLIRMLRYRAFTSRIDRVVAVSDHTKNEYIRLSGISANKVIVIPNAIQPYEYGSVIDVGRKRTELGLEDHVPVLLAVGRICEQKGYDTLLKVAELLKDRNQQYKLVIAGDGPQWGKMLKLRDDLNLQNEVYFLGRRNDVPELLQVADLFVQSSNWEGMPISILEAMMYGKPIVATAVDGTCELIRNGIEGVLVPTKDPFALATALVNLMADDSMRLRLGKGARHRAYKEFTMDVMVRRLMKLYEELLHDESRNVRKRLSCKSGI